MSLWTEAFHLLVLCQLLSAGFSTYILWSLPYDYKMAATAPGFTSTFQTQDWYRSYPPEALIVFFTPRVLSSRPDMTICWQK